MSKKKSLVLFDLDGVILDSKANMELAWKAVQEQLHIAVPFEPYFALIGRSFPDIIARLGLSERVADIERVFRIASASRLDLATFYPGVVPSLVKIQRSGVKLGLVTSKDRLRSNAILARLPVEFTSVQTPDPRYRGKPAPDHLMAAMAEAQADPAETVYVGDMDADYEAATRARVDYIHAFWGYGKPPKDCIIASQFSELLHLLEEGPK
jgi:phosphoglycolate phosphatase-like HAD superfamily hydrolase